MVIFFSKPNLPPVQGLPPFQTQTCLVQDQKSMEFLGAGLGAPMSVLPALFGIAKLFAKKFRGKKIEETKVTPNEPASNPSTTRTSL